MYPTLDIHPVVEPGGLWIGRRVPQPIALCGVPGSGTMVIKDHMQTDRAGIIDDQRHDIARFFPRAFRAGTHLAGGRSGVGFPHLIREWNADAVEAILLHLIEDEFIVLCPHAVGNFIARLETVPVHAGDQERLVGWGEDLCAARPPPASDTGHGG